MVLPAGESAPAGCAVAIVDRARPCTCARESAPAGCAKAIVDESLSVHVLLRGMVVVLPAEESAPAGCAVAIVDESLSVHVLLRGMVDAKAEAQKLGKRKGETANAAERHGGCKGGGAEAGQAQERNSQGLPVLLRGIVDLKAEAQKLGKRKGETAKLQEALAKKMGVPGLQEALAKKMGVPGLQEALAKKMGVPGLQEALAKKMGVPGLQEALAKKMGVLGLQEALAKKMGVPGYEEKVPSNVREENASKAAKLAAELASIDEAKKNFEKLMLDEASA
ncbi:unnamed protein product [Closterium sp. NIES-65]|nr:unnamed protein product [Closterium sp. NIES-65]